MTSPLDGVHVALVTPFAVDGTVDGSVLTHLVDDQLAAGIRGLVVGGGTGEGLTLTEEESEHVLHVTVAAARGRVPVAAHVSALSTSAAVRNAQRALDGGADIAMVQAPYDVPLSDEEIIGYFEAVAAVGLPIMVYNNVFTGVTLSVRLVAQLAAIDGVAYLKDNSADAARMSQIADLCGDGLQVLLGKDSLALFGFVSGARATVLGSPNAIPAACVRLHELTATPSDREIAQRLWKALLPVLIFFETEGYVPAVKAATDHRGIPVGPPRLPALPLTDEKRTELCSLLDVLETAMVASQPASMEA